MSINLVNEQSTSFNRRSMLRHVGLFVRLIEIESDESKVLRKRHRRKRSTNIALRTNEEEGCLRLSVGKLIALKSGFGQR